MADLPGFRVKYGGIEIEYYDQDNARVSNEYRKVMKWLQSVIEKTLSELERQIAELKEDFEELKQLKKEA